MKQINEMLINFTSSVKKGSNIKLLPVSKRQCFVFTNDSVLLGCVVLGDVTHYIGDIAGHKYITAHEYINDDLDCILIDWDYQTFEEITPAQWLNLVKYTN